MKDSEILPFCHKHGIKLPTAWRHCCQAVRFHNKNESHMHFLYKSEVAFSLMKAGQTVFTEFGFDFKKVRGEGRRMQYPCTDLFWLDARMVVEFESKITPEAKMLKLEQFRDFNCFVFDISKLTVQDILERIGVV